jgi:hypothetical protein
MNTVCVKDQAPILGKHKLQQRTVTATKKKVGKTHNNMAENSM